MAINLSASGTTIFKKFTLEQIEEASELQAGFCLACGEMRDMVEPDARRYKCDSCCLNQVYGAEEILLMGLVIGGEKDES
jgi:hypothetical protein